MLPLFVQTVNWLGTNSLAFFCLAVGTGSLAVRYYLYIFDYSLGFLR
jgi:hypothetical protein